MDGVRGMLAACTMSRRSDICLGSQRNSALWLFRLLPALGIAPDLLLASLADLRDTSAIAVLVTCLSLPLYVAAARGRTGPPAVDWGTVEGGVRILGTTKYNAVSSMLSNSIDTEQTS